MAMKSTVVGSHENSCVKKHGNLSSTLGNDDPTHTGSSTLGVKNGRLETIERPSAKGSLSPFKKFTSYLFGGGPSSLTEGHDYIQASLSPGSRNQTPQLANPLAPQNIPTSSPGEFFSLAGTSPVVPKNMAHTQKYLPNVEEGILEEDEGNEAQTIPKLRNSGKRKLGDVYDVPDGEEVAKHHLKAVKRLKQAKVPITAPPASTRRVGTRATTSLQELPAAVLPAYDTAGADEIARSPTDLKTKRGRGRPRKSPPKDSPPKHTSESNRRPTVGLSASQDGLGDNSPLGDQSIDAEAGVMDILMNPSPIKPPSYPKSKAVHPKRRLSPKRGNNPDNNVNNSEDQARNRSGQISSELEHFIKPSILDRVITTLKHVGHTQNRKTQEWDHVKSMTTPCTEIGKRLNRQLNKLDKAYGTYHHSDAAHKVVSDLIVALEGKCNDILTAMISHQTSGAGKDDTEAILTDLYFILIPKFMCVIRTALAVHTSDSPITTLALHEVKSLVDSLHKLSKKAGDQPKELQPTAGNYQISKPVCIALVTKSSLGCYYINHAFSVTLTSRLIRFVR
jgi:hypothetical protein